MTEIPTTPPPQPLFGGIAVTLISGTDVDAATRLARSITGSTAGVSEPAELESATQDTAEFALNLADQLVAEVAAGRRGRVVIVLQEGAGAMEIGLVLDHSFRARRSSEAPIVLCDLVVVSSVPEIRKVLFTTSDRYEAVTDFESPELFVSRLEFATCIVLTDPNGSHDPEAVAVRQLLHKLNPTAAITTAEHAVTVLQRRPLTGVGRSVSVVRVWVGSWNSPAVYHRHRSGM